MNYTDFCTHSESYTIDDKKYTATVDFVKEIITIQPGKQIFELQDYDNFAGDMEAFVKSKIRG